MKAVNVPFFVNAVIDIDLDGKSTGNNSSPPDHELNLTLTTILPTSHEVLAMLII